MRYFSAGIRTTSGTTTEAALEIIAGADKGFRLMGVCSIAMAAATASNFGIGRPAAKGVTPTTPLALQGNDGGIPSTAKTALAWSTSPTVPGSFYHKVTLPATIGAFIQWNWPADGIFVQPGKTIVLWNVGATGVVDFSFTIWE